VCRGEGGKERESTRTKRNAREIMCVRGWKGGGGWKRGGGERERRNLTRAATD